MKTITASISNDIPIGVSESDVNGEIVLSANLPCVIRQIRATTNITAYGNLSDAIKSKAHEISFGNSNRYTIPDKFIVNAGTGSSTIQLTDGKQYDVFILIAPGETIFISSRVAATQNAIGSTEYISTYMISYDILGLIE